MARITEDEARERFKDHVLIQSTGDSHLGKITTLDWGLPNRSSIDRIVYVIMPTGTLLVYGDLGSAVYQWHYSNRLSLEWLGGLDMSYFREKCQAFERGPSHRLGFEWDENTAVQNLQEMLDQALAQTSIDPEEIYGEPEPERCSVREFLEEHGGYYSEPLGSYRGWEAFIQYQDNYQRVKIPTKVEYKENQPCLNLEESCGIGLVPAYRLQLHWWGLRLAKEWEAKDMERIRGNLPVMG